MSHRVSWINKDVPTVDINHHKEIVVRFNINIAIFVKPPI